MERELTLQELINKLEYVRDGTLSRSEVSDWAFRVIADDDMNFEDEASWELVDILAGLDSRMGPNEEYLHPIEQIDEWLFYFKERLSSGTIT